MIRSIFTLILALIFGTQILAQETNEKENKNYSEFPYWIEMMQDPEANYYETVKAFEEYWEGREITRGNGWKPFKRWEYITEFRINPNGDLLPADHDRNAYYEFMKNNPPERDFTGDWTNMGPFTLPLGDRGYQGLGRINDVAFHPTDADILYIGAPSGGLWKTTDGGDTWSSTTDILPTLGVSAIIVDYNDPDNIYMGTGDRDAGDAPGLGVYRSTDAGATWEEWSNGMGEKTVGRMIQHPTNPQIMLAATSGGIYKTTDAGATWVQKKPGSFKEIVFKSDDPAVIYAASGGDFYKSTDTGETWTEKTNGLPGGARGVIAVTPDDTEMVYFLIANSQSFKGLYRSLDAGESFLEMSTSPNIMSWGCNGGSGGQAWYDLDVSADPNNADIIYAGGVNCFKSTNGGITWEINSHWWGDCGVPSVHADLHGLEWNPVDGRLYAVNDGGIYWTDNGGATWNEITDGLPISQAYKIGQSATARNIVINGYQDNGTSTYTGSSWLSVYGGDGMECAVDHEDSTISYATLYYGSIFRLTNHNNAFQVAGNGYFGINESGAWITPFCLAEHDADIMFVGYNNVWRSTKVKSFDPDWENITNNFAGFSTSTNRDVEHSQADNEILYVSRNNGEFYRSDNVLEQYPDWIDLTNKLPDAGDVFDIEAHPTNPDIVYIAQNRKIYKSEDRGMNWEDISGNLPDVNMNTIVYYERSQDGLYVGSNAGIYYLDSNMTDWISFSDGFPASAEVTELEIYYDPDSISRDVIRAGTYGRGLWESEPYYYAPEVDFYASETELPLDCSINFFDASSGIPHNYQWTFEGGTPSTSSEINPTDITYHEEGTFLVKLVVSNPAGTDSLVKEDYITVSSGILPTVEFTTSDSSICVGNSARFTDETENCPSGWLWEFEPDDVEFVEGTDENSQNPVVQFNNAGIYDVTLTAINSSGNSTITKEEYIHSGGLALPFEETFEEDNVLAGGSWQIDNPDGGYTWGIGQVGGTTPGDQAAWIELMNYSSWNERDKLISPSLDLTDQTTAYLQFKYAYTQRGAQKDSLIVYISDDCGESWTRLWQGGPDGTGVFATHEMSVNFFVPEVSSDWCGEGWGANCPTIDISEWAGMNDIKIAFESFNNRGNNLYIDNVKISSTVGFETEESVSELHVVPNPSHGIFMLSNNTGKDAQLKLFNKQGKEMIELELQNGSREALDISAFPNGIYLLKIKADGLDGSRKLIKQ
ncbi:MAG: PKD domain-containing protein [Bacteroidales bacterium]|nr:PKD domain-containing protein [Bacteroidales bacterium]MCF8349556.1 PKD domain-containing protein [Bacteroidales bacterium]MCF8375115.1 PKD domain-containing protein [Bacteroidales bacterium]MCF8400022.1 PKD domain-containing protein [Bacteroidales bacterium]